MNETTLTAIQGLIDEAKEEMVTFARAWCGAGDADEKNSAGVELQRLTDIIDWLEAKKAPKPKAEPAPKGASKA